MYRIGWASRVITPSRPAWLGGYDARTKPSQGVHDPISASACYLSDGQTETALLSFDLLAVTGTQIERIRQRAKELCGIGEIVVGATHTHSAPISCPQFAWGTAKIDDLWMESMLEAGVEAVAAAKGNAASSRLLTGSCQIPEVAKNRRDSKGVTDTLLHVLWAMGESGEPRGFIVNYPCHCTVLDSSNYQISADYPGFLYQKLRELYPGAVPVFFNGACGNQNIGYSADASALGADMGDLRSFANAGRQAAHIMKGIGQIMESGEELESAISLVRVPLEFPLRTLPPRRELAEELEELLRLPNRSPEQDTRRIYLVSLLKNIDAYCGAGGARAEGILLRLGRALIITIPGELFCEIGLQLKEMAPTDALPMVFCYTGGYLGYLPTSKACAEGGYECETSVHGPKTEPYLLQTIGKALADL